MYWWWDAQEFYSQQVKKDIIMLSFYGLSSTRQLPTEIIYKIVHLIELFMMSMFSYTKFNIFFITKNKGL